MKERVSRMLHKHGGDIYSYREIKDFSANINFRGMPESVRSRAVAAVDASVHYPDPEYRMLRHALAERERKQYRKKAEEQPSFAAGDLQDGMMLLEEEIICGNGAAEVMFTLASTLRPKKALLAVPSFFEYEQALVCAGCEIHHYYLKKEQDFRLDGDFLLSVSPDTDIIILGNPNNPTGRFIDREILCELLEFCKRKNIFLVLDESFLDFLTESDRKRTMEGVERIHDYSRLFVIRSFTKMYAMPGLRFGYGICSDRKLLEQMRTLMQPWNVSVPAEAAAVAASEELEFAGETAEMISVNREWMKLSMEKAGYRVFPSSTNFLLFQADKQLKEVCLESGFLIRDCSNFPGLEMTEDGCTWFRICVRGREENEALMEALRVFQQRLYG